MMIDQTAIGLGPASWFAIVLFAAAAGLLGALDVSQPRGDSLGVGGAIDLIAMVILGPFGALAACIAGSSAAAVAKSENRARVLAHTLLSRVGALVVVAVLLHPASGLIETIGLHLSASLAIAIGLIVELLLAQAVFAARRRRSFVRLVRGNVRSRLPLMLAQWSACSLAVVVYPSLQLWSLGFVAVLLVLIRQSYALLFDVRETYKMTVELLVDAAECSMAGMRGHAERTARIAREIAERCGLSPSEIERISYAALLHDVDAIGDYGSPTHEPVGPAKLLQGAGFFAGVVRVLRLTDHRLDSAADVSETDLVAALIVSLADQVDMSLSPTVEAPSRKTVLAAVADRVPAATRARVLSATALAGYGSQILS